MLGIKLGSATYKASTLTPVLSLHPGSPFWKTYDAPDHIALISTWSPGKKLSKAGLALPLTSTLQA